MKRISKGLEKCLLCAQLTKSVETNCCLHRNTIGWITLGLIKVKLNGDTSNYTGILQLPVLGKIPPHSILVGSVTEWLLYNEILSRFWTALVKRKMTWQYLVIPIKVNVAIFSKSFKIPFSPTVLKGELRTNMQKVYSCRLDMIVTFSQICHSSEQWLGDICCDISQ